MSTSIPKTSGIYMITCLDNHRFYIGSSINLYRRYKDHWRALNNHTHRNQHLQRAWDKYTESSFVFEILELIEPILIIEREQFWIDKLQPFNEIGFNIRPKADETCHAQETKQKIAESHKGIKPTAETRLKMSVIKKATPPTNLGRVFNDEWRANIGKAKTGQRWKVKEPRSVQRREQIAEEKAKNYIVTSPEGEKTIIKNLSKFCRENHLNRGRMCQVAMGNESHHKGWKCRHA